MTAIARTRRTNNSNNAAENDTVYPDDCMDFDACSNEKKLKAEPSRSHDLTTTIRLRGILVGWDVLLEVSTKSEASRSKKEDDELPLVFVDDASYGGNERGIRKIFEFAPLYRAAGKLIDEPLIRDDPQEEIVDKAIKAIRTFDRNETAIHFFVRVPEKGWRIASDFEVFTTIATYLEGTIRDDSQGNKSISSARFGDFFLRRTEEFSHKEMCDDSVMVGVSPLQHSKRDLNVKMSAEEDGHDIETATINRLREVPPSITIADIGIDQTLVSNKSIWLPSTVRRLLRTRVLEDDRATMVEPSKFDIVISINNSDWCRRRPGNVRCSGILKIYEGSYKYAESEYERFAVVSAVCHLLQDGGRVSAHFLLQYGKDYLVWLKLNDEEFREAVECTLEALSKDTDEGISRENVTSELETPEAEEFEKLSSGEPNPALIPAIRKLILSTKVQERTKDDLHLSDSRPDPPTTEEWTMPDESSNKRQRLELGYTRRTMMASNHVGGCSESDFEDRNQESSWSLDLSPCRRRQDRIIPSRYHQYNITFDLSCPLIRANEAERQYYIALAYLEGLEGFPQSNQEAIIRLRRAADSGHAVAPRSLGYLYLSGKYGLRRNLSMAARLYKMSADRGVGDAQKMLGKMYQYGRGLMRDLMTAAKYFYMAAEHGARLQYEIAHCIEGAFGTATATSFYKKAADEEESAYAQMRIGELYKSGKATAKDHEMAMFYFQSASDRGLVAAQLKLGDIYRTGDGVPKDFATAARFYSMAAEQGNSEGQFQLALFHRRGNGVPRDDHRAIELYRSAARQGHARALFSLGVMYKQGAAVEKDDAEAVRLYKLAADRGSVNAQFNLASMYLDGDGLPQDYAEAARLYRIAAACGDAEAQYNLANMHREGTGIPKDYAKAAALYRLAADQGDASAQCNLGNMYRAGQGVPQDHLKAAHLYHLAANRGGNANAQCNLASMYFSGEHLNQDFIKAARLFGLAADQGNCRAQFNLALMYRRGLGIAQDHSRAVQLYTAAANQGDKIAIHFLGFLFYLGDGVEMNRFIAFEWFQKSAATGSVDAHIVIAQMYARGEGIPETSNADGKSQTRNFDGAIRHYLLAIKLNGDAGSDWLNRHFIECRGLQLNLDSHLAVEHLMLAAGKGNIDAQHHLGVIFEKGRSVSIDHFEAIRFYKMAMEKGDMDACLKIARIFESGWNSCFDLGAAAWHFRVAAENGSWTSYQALGFKAYHSRGENKDRHMAIPLYERAAAAGNCQAQIEYFCLLHFSEGGVAAGPEKSVQLLEQASEKGNTTAKSYLARLHLQDGMDISDRSKSVKLCQAVRDQAFHSTSNFFDDFIQ